MVYWILHYLKLLGFRGFRVVQNPVNHPDKRGGGILNTIADEAIVEHSVNDVPWLTSAR